MVQAQHRPAPRPTKKNIHSLQSTSPPSSKPLNPVCRCHNSDNCTITNDFAPTLTCSMSRSLQAPHPLSSPCTTPTPHCLAQILAAAAPPCTTPPWPHRAGSPSHISHQAGSAECRHYVMMMTMMSHRRAVSNGFVTRWRCCGGGWIGAHPRHLDRCSAGGGMA